MVYLVCGFTLSLAGLSPLAASPSRRLLAAVVVLRFRISPLFRAVSAARLILSGHGRKVVVLLLPVAGDELELVPLVVLDPYPHISAIEHFCKCAPEMRE